MASPDSEPNGPKHSLEPVEPVVAPEAPENAPLSGAIPVAVAPQPVGLRQRIASSRKLMWLLVVATTLGSVLLFLFTSVVASVIAMVVANNGSLPAAVSEDTITELMKHRAGFVLSVLVPQLALLVLPILACFLLPAGPRKSLRLVRGNWPIWAWLAAAATTPMIGTLSSMLMGPFIEESASLAAMSNAFRHHANSGFLIPLLLIIGVTPSICEEILFRGFLQPRLTRLMSPTLGILIASLAFAAMHLDPIHVLGVIPLGIWLGFLSYKSGSLIPAMLGHLVNNVLSVLSVLPEDADVFDAPSIMTAAIVFGVGLLGLVGIAVAMFRRPAGQAVDADAQFA